MDTAKLQAIFDAHSPFQYEVKNKFDVVLVEEDDETLYLDKMKMYLAGEVKITDQHNGYFFTVCDEQVGFAEEYMRPTLSGYLHYLYDEASGELIEFDGEHCMDAEAFESTNTVWVRPARQCGGSFVVGKDGFAVTL